MQSRGNEARKPLVWELAETFTEGRVIGQVQCAEGHRGKLYSVRFGRENHRDADRPVPFLEPRDIPALRLVLDQVDDYLRGVRTEEVKSRFASGGQRNYV